MSACSAACLLVRTSKPAASAFFAVDDLDVALARVAELGGAHIPMGDHDGGDAAPLGRFAICRDDQGSLFGLHQPPGAGDPR